MFVNIPFGSSPPAERGPVATGEDVLSPPPKTKLADLATRNTPWRDYGTGFVLHPPSQAALPVKTLSGGSPTFEIVAETGYAGVDVSQHIASSVKSLKC